MIFIMGQRILRPVTFISGAKKSLTSACRCWIRVSTAEPFGGSSKRSGVSSRPLFGGIISIGLYWRGRLSAFRRRICGHGSSGSCVTSKKIGPDFRTSCSSTLRSERIGSSRLKVRVIESKTISEGSWNIVYRMGYPSRCAGLGVERAPSYVPDRRKAVRVGCGHQCRQVIFVPNRRQIGQPGSCQFIQMSIARPSRFFSGTKPTCANRESSLSLRLSPMKK
jgi:hypothetical protein